MRVILTGNVGNLYMLKLTKDGVYVASLLSKPIVPKDLSNLNMFKQTLDYLLKMKMFLVDTIKIVKRAIFQKEINSSIPELPATTSISRRMPVLVTFTWRRKQIKPRKRT